MRPTEKLKQRIGVESLWLYILSSLSKKSMSGKELKARIRNKFNFLTGTVTAYKVLYYLEKNKYVTSRKRGKYVLYSITNKGKKELSIGKNILLKRARRL